MIVYFWKKFILIVRYHYHYHILVNDQNPPFKKSFDFIGRILGSDLEELVKLSKREQDLCAVPKKFQMISLRMMQLRRHQ